jgi:hypothetical protein
VRSGDLGGILIVTAARMVSNANAAVSIIVAAVKNRSLLPV